mmetsp:Transcript_9738/g.24217  ORF Transcript_9738/g.24217 Transcript_9738/m.24217 type:complete len:239 (+) Transcript_9738:287-1003(+)
MALTTTPSRTCTGCANARWRTRTRRWLTSCWTAPLSWGPRRPRTRCWLACSTATRPSGRAACWPRRARSWATACTRRAPRTTTARACCCASWRAWPPPTSRTPPRWCRCSPAWWRRPRRWRAQGVTRQATRGRHGATGACTPRWPRCPGRARSWAPRAPRRCRPWPRAWRRTWACAPSRATATSRPSAPRYAPGTLPRSLTAAARRSCPSCGTRWPSARRAGGAWRAWAATTRTTRSG